MKKTYKHKKLWYIITEQDDSYEYDRDWSKTAWSLFYIPKELIENSDDWELQEEKDWIDELKDDIMWLYKLHVKNPPHEWFMEEDYENMWKDIKFHIEKHMPKITKEEMCKCYEPANWWAVLVDDFILALLKEKRLYKE